jgi:hypothetical protein
MCFFSGGPSMPGMPPPPPPPPQPPKESDPAVRAARDDARRRAAGLQGYGSTIATTGLGVDGQPNTTGGFKALLGQ